MNINDFLPPVPPPPPPPHAAPVERWAIISLFGHSQLAGRFEFENGLLRVDIPTPDGFRTKYIGDKAIFEMDVVSEAIARAAAPVQINPRPLDIPIVSREQYEETVSKQNRTIRELESALYTLKQRLTAINALPTGKPPEFPIYENDFDEDE